MNNKLLMIGVTAFLVGGSLGAGAGLYFGFEKGVSGIIDGTLQKDARGVRVVVGALRQIRRGAADDAIGVLERQVDDDLILFDPHEPYPGVSEATAAEVEKALEAVRRYRADYPRIAPRPAIDRMVDDFLGRGYRSGSKGR